MAAIERRSLPAALPGALAERTVELTASAPRPGGEFVLYWAHHALRAHQNPALEAAAVLALQLGLPLLVYQGLGGRHRYNADRHHRFILESARDFAGQLAQHGLGLHFHLPPDPADPGPLPGLLGRAAAAVSELYPAPPFPDWYRRHAAAHPRLPFLLVDASCILPMPCSKKQPTRAFQFRQAHGAALRERAATPWPEPDRWPAGFAGEPGFAPFDLDNCLDEAIASCRIDHSLPPVAATPAGSAAGYRRWSAFLERGLSHYHELRDDAALPEAVSRMSAYLHYGCVSALRIARGALAHGGEGADKFLVELLTWRELSHHFCHHADALESLDALPGWAANTLREHQPVVAGPTFDWETLLRGRTGEPLWDLAQRSLLRHGELHNNLRMSWGKAFLPWAPRPERALKLMVDLNHRLALDGSDPNSYGGLLWCLGQFDRPFPPAAVYGAVRRRSLVRHAARLDVDRYARQVALPSGGRRLRVAVVGAGLAGLNAARILEDQGHAVVVVEKARGPGGRMATRRDGDWRFDHGAQYFTARDPRFLRHVLAWRERGLVEAWDPRIAVIDSGRIGSAPAGTERFVAQPGLSAVCREFASELDDCRYGWRLQQAVFTTDRWCLHSTNGDSIEADALIVTTPPDQAGPLFTTAALRAQVESAVAGVLMEPCWAVMAVLERPLLTGADAAFVNEGPLSWICSQAAKPARPKVQSWVLHAAPAWSRMAIEHDPAAVADELLRTAMALPGAQPGGVECAAAHRWRYALAREPLDAGTLWFAEHRLALAGDWCAGSRIEGAFLSGAAAAGRVMADSSPEPFRRREGEPPGALNSWAGKAAP